MSDLWGGAALDTNPDTGLYELGLQFEIARPVLVSALRIYSPPGSQPIGVPRIGRIWDNAREAIVAQVNLPAELTDGWADYPLDVPAALPKAIYTLAVTTQNGYGTAPAPAGGFTTDDGAVILPVNPGRYTEVVGSRPTTVALNGIHYGTDFVYDLIVSADGPTITASAAVDRLEVDLTYAADVDVQWLIDWGDGSTSGGPGPKHHEYAQPGPKAILVQATSTIDGSRSGKAVLVETFPTAPAEDADPTLALLDLIDSWFGPAPTQAAAHGEMAIAAPANTEQPIPGEDPLPWAQAYAYTGDGDQIQSFPTADVAFFAKDYDTASMFARRFHARLMQYPHRVSSSGRSVLFDRVEVVSLPTEIPFVEGNGTRRFQATYSFSIRR